MYMYILYCNLIETYPTYLPTVYLLAILLLCVFLQVTGSTGIAGLSGNIHVDKEVKEEAAEEQEVEQEEADRYPEGEETGDQE